MYDAFNFITAIIIAAGIPTALTGFLVRRFEKRIDQRSEVEHEERKHRQRKADEREDLREKNELYLIQGMGAAIALGEATAKAVQRIPDAHCNGDMHAALAYAQKVKHEQKDFFTEQTVKNVI